MVAVTTDTRALKPVPSHFLRNIEETLRYWDKYAFQAFLSSGLIQMIFASIERNKGERLNSFLFGSDFSYRFKDTALPPHFVRTELDLTDVHSFLMILPLYDRATFSVFWEVFIEISKKASWWVSNQHKVSEFLSEWEEVLGLISHGDSHQQREESVPA